MNQAREKARKQGIVIERDKKEREERDKIERRIS